MAPAARAERIFDAAPPALTRAPETSGLGRVARLQVNPPALAAMRRTTGSLVLEDFPLGSERTATLEVERYQPFRAGTRVEVVGAGGPVALALPGNAYWSGVVRGEPGTRVFLIAAPAHVRGFVVADGTAYVFGPDTGGLHRAYSLREVDPAVFPAPHDFCHDDVHRGAVEAPLAAARALARTGPPPARFGPSDVLRIQVAIETDQEFRSYFASNEEALDYLAALLAAANTIYERDVNVRLDFSYIRLWTTTDPWTANGDTLPVLQEVTAYWNDASNNMDAIAGPHDLVHFLSGKDLGGGIAYVGAVCSPYGFGVSQVEGGFNLSDPNAVWDVVVMTHEVGHNVGSPHTHCYDPPVDRCFNQEDGCYSGAVVASRGTIMSYCHLIGGLSNIDLVFGDVVSTQIRSTVEIASCLDAVDLNCGNGALDAGEECDDGARVGGDGCSATCRLEVCGNGNLDPGEECDDANVTPGDGCDATCIREPVCGDGVLAGAEECDDGNLESGDGCSTACLLEPCQVLIPHQVVWTGATMAFTQARAAVKLAARAAFGVPVPFGDLHPDRQGMLLTLETPTGALPIDASLPAGGAWTLRGKRWLYRDPSGSVAGIRKVVIRQKGGGAVTGLVVQVSGSYATFPVASADLPLAMTMILGDANAGATGACGRYQFGAGCSASRKRVRCR